MPSYIRTRTEFAVNSFTSGTQAAPSVSTFADGGFVVTWVTTDPTQDGDDNAIKAQLFDSAGRKVGIEFLVNSLASGGQVSPSVETLANGNFVVTWGTNSLTDGTRLIEAQLFSRNGDRIGAEFQVIAPGSSLFEPSVTSLAGGRFIISWDDWSSQSVKGQIFDSAGARVGGVLTLANTSAQGYGDVIGLANGGFVATWRVNGTSWDVKAQVFDASGGKVGGEFLVNTTVAGSQNAPTAAALADGSFVISWTESNPEFSSGNSRIKAQLFSASGQKIGGELLVSTSTAYTMGSQVVTALPDGGFVIAWYKTNLVAGGGSDSDVLAQRFTAAGVKVDGEFLVNTLTTGSQWLPDLDTLADGRVISVWQSSSGDLDGSSVRAQILGPNLAAPLPNTAPVIISSGGGSSASLIRDEGLTAVTTVVASDDGEPNNLRYSITGGADAALFTIDALTGALAFRQAPDHEAPRDQGADNVYSVVVTASDGQLSGAQSIEIDVRHVNYITIVSDGGYDYAYLSVDENQRGVTVVSAIDDDGAALTYSITGGDDAAFFTIDPETGELSFTVAPDYEHPANMYGDNVYYVQVTASDGTRSDAQDLAVQVNDVNEPDGFVITSDGGGDQAQVDTPENVAAVTIVAVSGAAGPVTYEIVGGYDQYLFTIDAATGQLSFLEAPDYENIAGGWGSHYSYWGGYQVIVRASDGASFDEQEFKVLVGDVDEAPIFYSYWGEAEVALTVAENTLAVGQVVAGDPDGYPWITYGIDGGADAGLFQIDPSSGEISFTQAPDAEAPADADGDNVYEVAVVAYSDGLSATQSFSITVANVNEQPVIESNASLQIVEGETAVTNVSATDPDGDSVSFAIAGGADAALFAVDVTSGALRFLSAPDFEAPADSDGDNVYYVEVSASDGQISDSKSFSVSVADRNSPVALGGEFTVNSTYARSQAQSDVTKLADGNFLVTWVDADFNTSAGRFLRAQIFAPDGVKMGGELTLASGNNVGTQPAVAALPDGGFVVASRPLGSIVVQMFDSAGQATGSQITVSNAGSSVGEPQIAVLANGGFAITWDDNRSSGADISGSGVHLRAYNASGAPVGGDLLVNTSTAGNQADPSISALAGGGYVVTWTDRPGQGAPWVAKAQIFNSAGARVGGEFILSGPPTNFGGVVETSVVSLSNGNFAVAWTEGNESGPAHRVQIFSPDGTKVGDQIVVQSNAYLLQVGPSLTALSDGGFALAWSPNNAPYSDGSDRAVFVQAYDAAGRPNGAPMQANVQTNGDQLDPSIAALADGRFVVSWTDLNGAGADDDQVMARIFAPEKYVPNQRPVIESDGGGASASLQIDEGQTAVTTVVASDLDGPNPVTYAITGGANAGLFEIDSATGELSFVAAPDFEAPAPGSNNVYTVTVRASDGELSAFQTLSITVADVNENVVITSDGGGEAASVAVAENGTAVTTIAANGPGTVTYSIVGGADASAFVIDAATGALAFAAAPNFEWIADADQDNVFEVVVRADNGLTSDDQHLSVNVTNVDESPDFFDHEPGVIELWTAENRAYVGILQAYDVDGGPAITYSVTGGADGALFVIDPTSGELSLIDARGPDFESPADADGDNVYEVEVTAAAGAWSQARAFTVTVVDQNEAVVITSNGGGTSAAIAIDEGETTVTTVVGHDPDGTAPTYSIIGGADAARFTIDSASGVLSFVDAPDYEAPADEAADNFYTVQVAASDGQNLTWQTIQILVGNVNEGLDITSYGGADIVIRTISENEQASVRIEAVDRDGEAPTYSITGGADAALFAIDAATGALSFVATPDFEAPADEDGDNDYIVTVTASDGQYSATQTFGFAVVNANEPLAITSNGGGGSAAISIGENGRDVTVVAAEDEDGTSPTFAIVGGADAARFKIDAQTGALSFVAAPDREVPGDAGGDNVYDVVVRATDGSFTDDQAIAVTVTNVDEGLAITSYGGGDTVQLSMAANGAAVGQIAAVDQDGDPVSYRIAGGADAGLFRIDPATGALSFIAPPDFESRADADGDNVYQVEVAAVSGAFTDVQAFAVTITNVNEGIAITSGGGGATATVAAAENSRTVATIVAEDQDGTSPTYAIVGGADASRFTIDARTGVLQFVSAPDREAPADAGGNNVYDVVVRATDGAFYDDQALAVTVGNVDEGLGIVSYGGVDTVLLDRPENAIAVGQVAAIDQDGDSVTYSIAGGADAALFRIDPATGALSFVAAPNREAPADANGDNVYKVEVAAISGAFSDTQAFAITVTNVNEGLTITSNGGGSNASVAVGENGRDVTVVAAADLDGTQAAYSIVGGADAARFTINSQTGLLQFVASPDYELPGDSNGDNVYSVVVQAGDGVFTANQVLSVGVANLRDGNVVTGTTGGDSISGTSTNPALRTTGAEDNVSGRDGNDTILGLGGDDWLAGDAGNDVLNGGAGADRMTGGLGKDQFVYNLASESTPAARDVITDFSHSQNDKISLSGIDANSLVGGNQSFAFIGSAAFSNVAGQLRFETSGGVTLVSGDIDGDGVADFQIELSGAIVPVASDFVL